MFLFYNLCKLVDTEAFFLSNPCQSKPLIVVFGNDQNHLLQGASSTYEVVETSTGGKLSRHNLHIRQLGPETVTEISTFHLSGSNQTQDLHSRLVLDHPRGYSRQLHKCIVTHSSGQAVFDGNIKVNRYFDFFLFISSQTFLIL